MNPTRPPARCRMPALSALPMPAAARSRRAAARDDHVLCRAGGRRHGEEPVGGARRQRGKPRPEQLLEVLGDGERLAGRRPDSLP